MMMMMMIIMIMMISYFVICIVSVHNVPSLVAFSSFVR